MKISFSKISTIEYPFELNLENIIFEGKIKKINPKLLKIEGKMRGFVYRLCDSCGEEIEIEVNEKIEVFASDGIFKDEKNQLSNTIEFFDGSVDLTELAISELESYLSDYFYCSNCKNK